MMIPADHSGPSFNFSGEVASKFRLELLRWLEEKMVNDDELSIDEIWADRGGAVGLRFDAGDGGLDIAISSDRRVEISVSGDAQGTPIPDDSIMEQAQYSDEEGDAYLVYKGKVYSLDELAEILKTHLSRPEQSA